MALIANLLRKIGILKPLPEKKLDINLDLRAVMGFLSEVDYDVQRILKQLRELQSLRREYRVLQDENMKKTNMTKQVNIFDQILDLYHYFEDDADINGHRIKNIAHAMKKAIEKTDNQKLIKKTQDPKWTFNW
ncbi:hypothetical protein ACFLZB_02925 [Nanoarchaeota archaeon]